MFLTTAALLIEGPMITPEAGSINVLTGLSSSFNVCPLSVVDLWFN
jgi:hypothetical protein